jgi:hypothetical protein
MPATSKPGPPSSIQRADTPPGQAGKWLTERFAEQLPLLEQVF